MISQKMILTMYDYSFYLVGEGLEGINHQDSLLTPPGGGNPANWILGHIITSRCNVLAALKIDPPWDFNSCKPYIPDSEPPAPGDDVEDFETMKTDLEKTQELLLKAFQNLSNEELEEKTGENSLGEDLAGYAIHEAYHAGELSEIKRLLKT